MSDLCTPDQIYAKLFEAVQSNRIFSDSKTFVDAIPTSNPSEILNSFLENYQTEEFDLRTFVELNFELPVIEKNTFEWSSQRSVRQHIEQLWEVLTRAADIESSHSSLVALPFPYLVPGGTISRNILLGQLLLHVGPGRVWTGRSGREHGPEFCVTY